MGILKADINIVNKKNSYMLDLVEKFGAHNAFIWFLMSAERQLHYISSEIDKDQKKHFDFAVDYINKADRIQHDYKSEISISDRALFSKMLMEVTKYDKY